MTPRIPQPQGTTRFSTVQEVADVLRVSKMTVYRLVHAEEIPSVRVGRGIRIPTAGVWRYLEDRSADYLAAPRVPQPKDHLRVVQ